MPIDLDLSMMSGKQERFFRSRKRFVCYGGARGGGKSWSLRMKITMMALKHGGIRILLLRRTYPELEQNHIRVLRSMLKGTAKYTESKKTFEFANGSVIILGYCKSESDVLQYQGNEYDVICIDEATQFTYYQFQTLTACVRGANSFPKRMYLTCNPGGVGHEWVKRLFITRKYERAEKADDYEFIGATAFDNKALLKHDPEYIDMLNNLDDDLRAAWRDGNWDMLAGQYFKEFRRSVHVIEPFAIPDHWRRYRGIDYGLDCLACVWVAIDEGGNYYVYREYAESDKIISEGAQDICALSEGERIEYTVAPPDMWSRSQESAKDKSDIFAENGLVLIKGSNDREAGWLAVKEMLRIYGEGDRQYARLKIFSSCERLSEYLPALQRSVKKPTDCMTEPHEITHLPDALRYFMLLYTTPSKPPEEKTELQKYREKVFRELKRGQKKHRRF